MNIQICNNQVAVKGMKHGTARTTQSAGGCQGSKFSNKSECLGAIPGVSGKLGSVEVGVSREDSDGRDTLTSEEWGDTQVSGKVIDQLADEVDREIEYHKTQIGQLENRSSKLRQLSSELKEVNNSD